MAKDIVLGWYQIEENWDMHIDGELTNKYIDYIHIAEKTDEHNYRVEHYGADGELIADYLVHEDDFGEELSDYYGVTSPSHIQNKN